MGLDQWLIAKMEKKPEDGKHTGVCSGLFGVIPTAIADSVELGYWRNAYDQNQLILDTVSAREDEKGNILVTPEEIDEILEEARRILKEHKFDNEGYDTTDDDLRFKSFEGTWLSKDKWEDTIKFFEKAKEILQKDPDAKIYYHIWY